MNKKIDFNIVKKYFPLTVQNARVGTKPKSVIRMKIITSDYQSSNVNSQQFYKPMSKIIQF